MDRLGRNLVVASHQVPNIGNAITRLPMDRLGRKLGGHIPSCPRHIRRDAVAMATAVA